MWWCSTFASMRAKRKSNEVEVYRRPLGHPVGSENIAFSMQNSSETSFSIHFYLAIHIWAEVKTLSKKI